MKHYLYICLSIVLILSGCQTDPLREDMTPKGESDFIATIENFDSQTKTSLTPENKIVWSSGDRLAIFQGSTIADTYAVNESFVGKSEGSFSLVSDNSGSLNSDFSSGMEIPANIAIYPYMEGLGCASINISETSSGTSSYSISNITIPDTQIYTENSFPEGAFPMVAVTTSITDHRLKFRNVFGAMKLQLYGTGTIKSITIEGNNGEILSGEAQITAYSGSSAPVITLTNEDATSVTLNCGESGIALKNTGITDFIIALPPVKFEKGFTVTITDTEDIETVINATVENEVKRSFILRMPVVRLPLIDLDADITFEDEEVKEACVTAFDTDGDGELSYIEAAAVTDLSLMTISDQTTFNKFNELQYFTSVTLIPWYQFAGTSLEEITLPVTVTEFEDGAFINCSKLKEIAIPEGVTVLPNIFSRCSSLETVSLPSTLQSISNDAFSKCSSLKNITIPAGVTEIGEWAFYKCSALESITIPAGVSNIWENTFFMCSSLSSVSLPSGLKTIGESAFYECTSLESMEIPDGVTEIGECAFYKCTALESITLPDALKTISNSVLGHCYSLTSIDIPSEVSEIGEHALYGCSLLESIDLPAKVTTIGELAFASCTSLKDLYIRAATYVEYNENYGGTLRDCTAIENIHVPSSLVNSYISSSWNTSTNADIVAIQ